jgi:16S rRNA (guanine966-N2)-methyltransferase
MRVTGGAAKSVPLRTPKVQGVRPTTDLVRNALFNILAPLGIEDAIVIDLYAGTGSLGIDALSRGAAHADFVESNHSQAADIRANLVVTKLQGKGSVFVMTVEKAVGILERSYDLVLMDPPYKQPFPGELIEQIETRRLLSHNGLIVVGHPSRRPAPEKCGGLVRWQDRRYGDSSLAFYVNQSEK